MDNLKAFLEADALRTQGEWGVNDKTSSGWMDNSYYLFANDNIAKMYGSEAKPNVDFIAAASRIAPDLAKMVEDMRVVREALEFYADFEDNTDDGQYQTHEDGDPDNMFTMDEGAIANKALTRLKPYEKLFEKEGE